MKTTNYEISKKLNYAGFKAQSDTLIHDPSNPITGERYASFCLETILEALPKVLQEYELCIYFGVSFEATKFTYNWQKLEVKQNWNESLADTAGKLWLLLKEKGLV
jgi:hypothetical protein